jgi:hypothetical protein
MRADFSASFHSKRLDCRRHSAVRSWAALPRVAHVGIVGGLDETIFAQFFFSQNFWDVLKSAV